MNIHLLILTASTVVQAANVVLAFRLIRRTKKYLAGGMIISAVILMVFRRTISLYRYYSNEGFTTDLAAEIIALIISILFFVAILYITKIIESEIKSRREKENLILDLRNALAEIKTLQGIIPICASCKKIRDDKGYWNKLEKYLSEHSTAEFSHSICPVCAEKLYPDFAQNPPEKEKKQNSSK